MRRWLSGAAVLLGGAALGCVAVLGGLPEAAGDFDALVDDARPVVECDLLDVAADDLAALRAIPAEFSGRAVPALALALLSTPEHLVASFEERYPAVMSGLRMLDEAPARFAAMVETVASQRDGLAAADAIPTEALPAIWLVWALAALAAAAVIAGCLVLGGFEMVGGAIAATVGVSLVVGSLALGLPSKASAADEVNRSLAPILTEDTVIGARSALGAGEAMVAQFSTVMLPDLARRIPLLDEDDLLALVAGGFPAIHRGLATMPEQVERFESLVALVERNLGPYAQVKPISLAPRVWASVGIGGLLSVAGMVILLTGRRRG